MSESQLSLQQPEELSIPAMLSGVIQSGVTKDNVEAIERLCALHERMQDKASEREFNAAFSDLQREMPRITASKGVPGKDGRIKYHYAPYEEIMGHAKPVLSANGFAVTFDSACSEDGKRVTVKCNLLHKGGHSRSNSYTGRIGSGPPNASEAQSDGAGYTYAKRFALCAALGITVESDTDGGGGDANAVGAHITDAQAAEVVKEMRAAGLSRAAVKNLFDWLGVGEPTKALEARVALIPANRLSDAKGWLAEAKGAPAAKAATDDQPEVEW